MTITLASPASFTIAAHTPAVRSEPNTTADSGWVVRLVDMSGTVSSTLVNANVDEVVEELNGVGSISFTIPKVDPSGASGQYAAVALLAEEVQVYKDGQIIGWGVPVGKKPSGKKGDVPISAASLEWYLARRFVDKVRTNYLSNPEFESGLTGWTATSCTATVITSPRTLNTQAVRLVGSSTGGDQFLTQSFSITGTAIGTNVYLIAHYYLEAFTGPALDTRGLYLEARDGGGNLTDLTFYPIDAYTPVGEWQRNDVMLWVPPSTTWTLYARLYAPNGSVVWDACQAVIPESLFDTNVDIATMAGEVIVQIQDTSAGKSDLKIGTDTPPVGVALPAKDWQYAEHTPALSAIGEMSDRDDGFDWWIDFTKTTRSFKTAHPSRGVDRTGSITLTLGGNLADYELDEDAASVVTDALVYDASLEGPDREEGHDADTSNTGGLVLQGVWQAPPSTPIDSLKPMATERLNTGKKVVRHLTATCTEATTPLIGVLHPGDTVTVVISDGGVSINSGWRIQRQTIKARTNTMVLELVEV